MQNKKNGGVNAAWSRVWAKMLTTPPFKCSFGLFVLTNPQF